MRSLKSPVTWLTFIAIALGTVQAQWTDAPQAVVIVLGAVLAGLGYLVYGKVTPVNDPHDNEGNKLVPPITLTTNN